MSKFSNARTATTLTASLGTLTLIIVSLVVWNQEFITIDVSALDEKNGKFAALLLIAAVSTIIAGAFGMLGGILLIGSTLTVLDVPSTMLFATPIMICSNAWRVATWFRHVRWATVLMITNGAIAAFIVMLTIDYRPSKAVVYLSLGLPPLLINMLPRSQWPAVDGTFGGPLCGFFSAMFQFVGGANAPITELFFQSCQLTRLENIALKAAFIVPIVAMRGILYSVDATFDKGAIEDVLPIWLIISTVIIGVAGTWLGGFALRHLFTDKSFVRWTWILTTVASVIFVGRGLLLLGS